MKQFEFTGVKFIVGKNAQENWDILDTYKKIDDKYVWFHLNSFPSCYVIMCSTLDDIMNKPEDNNVNVYLNYGAYLCKDNSKYSGFNNLKIIYTTLDKLTKTNKIGEVHVTGKPKIITL